VCIGGHQNGTARRRDSFGILGDFYKNIYAIAAIISLTILCTVLAPGYKIAAVVMLFWRILTVSYEESLELLSRDDRFRATVYAMNTLLIHKGIYTQKEFQQLFVEWASKQRKISTQEIGREARIPV
jgi:hypothetical protein